MGLFDDLYAKASDTVKDVDLSQGTQAFVNAYFQAQAAQVAPAVKIGPDPAAAALLPANISQATSAVTSAASKIPKWVPIAALAGAVAYYVMKRKK